MLGPGQSRAGLICPRCFGGRTGEASVSAWRTDWGAGWTCHRASCGAGGFDVALPTGREPSGPSFKPRPYPYPLRIPAPDSPALRRLNAGGFPPRAAAAARVGLAVRGDRPAEVVWELRGYDLRPRGHISRDYGSDGLGKFVRTWRTVPGPVYGFFGLGAGFRDLWLVEDCYSAARLWLSDRPATALCGTHLSREGGAELGAYLSRVRSRGLEPRILVALDRDAFGVGVTMAQRLTHELACDTIPVPLALDLKDMDPAEFDETVQRWSPDATA